MTTTREDRVRAVVHCRNETWLTVDHVRAWCETGVDDGAFFGRETHLADAFAAHRLAAVAGERERLRSLAEKWREWADAEIEKGTEGT